MSDSRSPRSPLGRGIVLVLFGALIGWSAWAILGSVIVDLYGKPPSAGTTELDLSDRMWCIRRLAGLRDELQGRVTFEARTPPSRIDPLSRWQGWNQKWLADFDGARSRCALSESQLTSSYTRLAQLHAGYAEATVAIIRTRAEIGPQLDTAIESMVVQQ